MTLKCLFNNMALVTVQRSPSSNGPPLQSTETETFITKEEEEEEETVEDENEEGEIGKNGGGDESKEAAIARQRSISECYFAVKGAALVLPQNECIHLYKKLSANEGGDIQQHLQSMFYLLRSEDTLKMAVKLESIHAGRMRYLVVVSCIGKENSEESCLLGVDCNERAKIGLVLPVWADTRITLDGDGGFSVSSSERHHIFKPVSVQAMWSALQTLHKASAKAREYHYFMGGLTHSWIEYYEKKIESDRSCLNEWYAMDNLESRRPPSPDCLRSRPMEREITEQDIRVKLKEIMMTVDLDEVTSKYIRTRLEEDLDMDLHEYKSFIDQEMITILGQMDAATEIFDHLYLGSEWNASNLEELQKNGVGHILNVTREIDNFFPGMFDYLNVRVYDDEGTELLKHWDTTYKFITSAKEKGSKVLVHCKMGVSRSASVVIAYAMKAHSWNMQTALQFVKNRRTCVKPNLGFMKQLEIYQGILDASKHRHNTLWRSKSENNLKMQQEEPQLPEEPKIQEALYLEVLTPNHRPKSWSPDDNMADMLFPETATDAVDGEKDSNKMMNGGNDKHGKHVLLPCRDGKTYSVSPNKVLHLPLPSINPEPVKFQIGDDESPIYECRNPIYEDVADILDDKTGVEVFSPLGTVPRVSSIKDRINELESQAQLSELRPGPNRDRLDIPENKGLVLNLANQFESGTKSNPSSPIEETFPVPPPLPLSTVDVEIPCESELACSSQAELVADIQGNGPILSQTKPPVSRHQAVLVKPESWAEDMEQSSMKLLADKGGGLCASDTNECVTTKSDSILWSDVVMPNTVVECSTSPLKQSVDDLIMRVRVNNQVRQISGQDVSESSDGLSSKDTAKHCVVQNCALSQQSPPIVNKQNDPFSAQLDRVFDEEETKGGVNVPVRHDSWGSCDSAISMSIPGQRESPSRQSSWGSAESRGTLLSRECSWGSADAKRLHPCGPTIREDLRNIITFSGEPTTLWSTDTIKKNKKNTNVADADVDCTLKRTSSFDGALPFHIAREAAYGNAGCEVAVGVIEHVQGSVIQRSQSLRNSTMSSKHQATRDAAKVTRTTAAAINTANLPAKTVPLNLRLHGPKPYKSPSEKRTFKTMDKKSPVKKSPDGTTTVHYSSTPILYKSSSEGGVPSLHSASQPNIPCVALSHSASTTAVPNANKCRSNLWLDFAESSGVCCNRTPPQPPPFLRSNNSSSSSSSLLSTALEKGSDVDVPSYGIVKQHKEALENFIASTPNKTVALSSSPPKTTERRVSSTTNTSDEWKKVQQKLQTFESQSKVMSSPHEQEDYSGVVRRITREMEAKGVVNVGVSGSNVPTGVADNQKLSEKMIIVDQHGKELITASQSSPTCNVSVTQQCSALARVPSSDGVLAVLSLPIAEQSLLLKPTCSPAEEKTVKSLVGKFEVKEQKQQTARHRYFSETEVGNMPWNGSPPPVPPPPLGSTVRNVIGSPIQSHRKSSLDSVSEGYSSKSTILQSTGCNGISREKQLPTDCKKRSVCSKVANESTVITPKAVGIIPCGISNGSTVQGKSIVSTCRPPPALRPNGGNETVGVSGGGGGNNLQQSPSIVMQRKLKKSQLGRSHPLPKLPRNTNSLYNTM